MAAPIILQRPDEVEAPFISKHETANSDSPNEKSILNDGAWKYWTHWRWESAACLLVLLTPGIMFATLYPHKGQPLPAWPFGISMNAVLAIYTLVFRTAMGFVIASCLGQRQWAWFSAQPRSLYDMVRFDNATRGAWGSLLLILWHRLHEPLTALGALVAILAVGIDPFVQQIVQTTDCSIAMRTNTSAGLPRTNMYTTDTTMSTIGWALFQQQLESSFQNAIHSPGQPAPWTCSTGNCTFSEPYTTIGFCSSCMDASKDVAISANCEYANNSVVGQATASASDCPDGSSFVVASTYLGGSSGMLTLNATILSNGVISTPADTAVATITPLPEGSGLLGGVHSLAFSYLLGKSANPDGNGDWIATADCTSDETQTGDAGPNWPCQGYGAATCQLYPCVQEYRANISAGVLSEEMISHSPEGSWGSILALSSDDPVFDATVFLATLDTECLTQAQRNALIGRGYKLDGAPRWIPFNFNVTADFSGTYNASFPTDIESLLEDDCLALALADDIFVMGEGYLSGIVQASGVSGQSSMDGLGGSSYTLSGFEGPDVLQSMYNWGDGDFARLESIFANISNSLTLFVRTQGSSKYSTPAEGMVYHSATCLQLQWPWISFPGILAILTTVFFILVVETTAGHKTPVWKSSPLAWILNVRDGQQNEKQNSSLGDPTVVAMEEKSKKFRVHLFHLPTPHIGMFSAKA